MTTDVPKMTYVLPLRRHLTFTTNSLPSIIVNASRDHEIIIVLDKCPLEYEQARRPETYPVERRAALVQEDREEREVVYRWVDAHQKALSDNNIKVLDFHGDERYWTGGLRAAAAMNMGTKTATADYVVVFGDEDLCFMPGWDRAMWDVLKDHDPMRHVALPVLAITGVCDPHPSDLTPAWIHSQRGRLMNHLAYPVSQSDSSSLLSGRFPLENFSRFVVVGKQAGCVEEPCGVRGMCHWVPIVMHRKLFDQMGGYPTGDNAAFGYDIVLDDTLAAMGVKKRMPLDHMILHTKFFVHMSDEIDRVWGDAAWLAQIQKRMIP
jgi:hypothetical protein